MHNFSRGIHSVDTRRCVCWAEPNQTSKMELFAKIVNGFQTLTMFVKRSILEVLLSFECVPALEVLLQIIFIRQLLTRVLEVW